MPKSFDCQLDTLGGKRTLHVSYESMANPSFDEEIRIRALMPVIFRRVVGATNHAYARGLGFKSAAELARRRPSALPYTRLKDWLKIQRKLIASPNVSAWNEESFDFIYGSARKEWRLDNHSDTKEYFERLLGKDHRKLLASTVSKTPDDKARVFKESLLGVISAFNLENVYVNIRKMEAVGSSVKSFGVWRGYHDVWDPSDPKIAYGRSRMEQHLVSGTARTRPINLNVKYISTEEEGGQYDDVYGEKLSLEDHITKTFIHEGSHMWCAAEDHYYWRPRNKVLRAYASLGLKDTVAEGQMLAPVQVETERCILNADTIGWFLYWWGKA